MIKACFQHDFIESPYIPKEVLETRKLPMKNQLCIENYGGKR